MFISKINTNYNTKFRLQKAQHKATKNVTSILPENKKENIQFSNYLKTNFNVSFGLFVNPNRLVGDVDLETYQIMNEKAKERYRKIYSGFATNEEVEQSKLFDKKSKQLPLVSDENLKKFIEISKIYLKYKDQPIICVGRSPKWFLNTAFWMKDGIPDYKFVAFSGYWYLPKSHGEAYKLNKEAPTKEEETAYRKYLDRIGVTPQKIVETMNKEGKKTVITDYICSGKGACSFLDILSRYAKDEGILEEFSKSIQIVGIGSMEYMEMLNPMADTISIPRVPMPELLEPYTDNIKQEFYDIDYNIFEEMLLNRNTNECRSTYYPHTAWTVYTPDVFKTGLITDMKEVKKLLDHFKDEKYVISFSAPMQDYRNLLNFRILDYLNNQNMLRKIESYMDNI